VALQGEQALGVPLLDPKLKRSDKDKKRRKDRKHKKDQDKHKHKKVGQEEVLYTTQM
jgi:hypothetical protein